MRVKVVKFKPETKERVSSTLGASTTFLFFWAETMATKAIKKKISKRILSKEELLARWESENGKLILLSASHRRFYTHPDGAESVTDYPYVALTVSCQVTSIMCHIIIQRFITFFYMVSYHKRCSYSITLSHWKLAQSWKLKTKIKKYNEGLYIQYPLILFLKCI